MNALDALLNLNHWQTAPDSNATPIIPAPVGEFIAYYNNLNGIWNDEHILYEYIITRNYSTYWYSDHYIYDLRPEFQTFVINNESLWNETGKWIDDELWNETYHYYSVLNEENGFLEDDLVVLNKITNHENEFSLFIENDYILNSEEFDFNIPLMNSQNELINLGIFTTNQII